MRYINLLTYFTYGVLQNVAHLEKQRGLQDHIVVSPNMRLCVLKTTLM